MKLLTLMILIWPVTMVTAQDHDEPIGRIVAVSGNAEIVQQDGHRIPAVRRSAISLSETLETGLTGSLQIRFKDGAILLLGCNSSVEIKRYLSNNNSQIEMILNKGRLRTITGPTTNDRYSLATGIGNIRVTTPNSDFEIAQENDNVMLTGVYFGSIEISTGSGALALGIGADFDFSRVERDDKPIGATDQPPELGVNSPCT